MKLMDISSLNALSNALNGLDIGESILYGRIEAYSCKMTGNDRKLQVALEQSIQDQLGSPNHERLSVSPFGPLTDRMSRQTLIYLITTLNCAFPYYDFSDTNPEQFNKEVSSNLAVHQISSLLSKAPQFTDEMRSRMWNTIDAEIQMNDCDVYSFNPDDDSDPFDEDGNSVWSFNYFFYNRKLKRILLVTCRAEHKAPDEHLLVETEGGAYGTSRDYETWVYDEMDMEQ
jgi:hypothetical protein